MNLRKLLLTKNACYLAGVKLTPRGIMVHSTGVNNPSLKRYVGPDDGRLGVNAYNNHWNQNKPDGRSVCVHAFIGKLADGSIATYQTLPWDMKGWHGGSGKKGSINDTHIGFEICEDGLADTAYLGKVYQEAVELCAYLCDLYKLNPTADGVIIGHYEGHARGLASNHGDPRHWWDKHGRSMDAFRADVKKAMGGATAAKPPATAAPSAPATNVPATDNAAKIWAFLKAQGLNDYAVAGLMGNLYAESGLNPMNLQNAYEKKLGYTDATYTAAVDNYTYKNFVRDGAGYGLAQWTFWSRKENLYQYARLGKKSIGDLQTQLEFLWRELQQSFSGVMAVLKSAASVRQASDVVLLEFERPADQSEAVKVKRASYGQGYFVKYAGGASAPAPASPVPYTVRVTDAALNIRKGPGTNFTVVGCIRDKGVYTIVEEAAGSGAKMWGKLKSGAGYISLDFTKKM